MSWFWIFCFGFNKHLSICLGGNFFQHPPTTSSNSHCSLCALKLSLLWKVYNGHNKYQNFLTELFTQYDFLPSQEIFSIHYAPLPPALQFGAAEFCGFEVIQHCVVFALLPQLIAIWLQAAHKHIHGDLHHVFTTGTLKENKNKQTGARVECTKMMEVLGQVQTEKQWKLYCINTHKSTTRTS